MALDPSFYLPVRSGWGWVYCYADGMTPQLHIFRAGQTFGPFKSSGDALAFLKTLETFEEAIRP